MGKILEAPLQSELIQSFHDYFELFTWSYKDMPGLDENFVVHNLVVEKGAMPVKQKARKMSFQISLLVKKEIEKFFGSRIHKTHRLLRMDGQYSSS